MLTAEQARLTALDTRRGELEANRNVYEAFLEKLNVASDGTRVEVLRDLSFTPELAADPVLGRVSQQVLVYQTRLDSLITGPLPAAATNPDVVQLKALIKSTQEELVRALRAHLASIDAQSKALAALRTRAGASIQRLPATKAEEVRLERLVEALSTTSDLVRQEFEKARMAKAIPAGDAQVVDWAPLPYKPAGVPPWAKLGLGLVLGLCLGTGAAGLAEGLNTSIMRPEELERDLKLRDLGVIPRLLPTGASAHPLRRLLGSPPDAAGGGEGRTLEVVVDSAPSLGAEAFRMLYTGLMFEWGQGPRTILVTSAAPQEGKTMIAANLAATFAREGSRVLLVDCDLWRPRLHKVFGVARDPGLSELLTSKEARAQSPDQPRNGRNAGTAGPIPGIRRTMVEGLSVLPCGAVPDPTTVLKTHRLRSLLKDLSGQFDLIILDTPPVLVSADAPLLAPLTDGAILVVRAGQTPRASVERAYQHLMATGAHFLGAVLNDPAGEVSRYGNYYYSYGYAAQAD